MSEFEKMLAEHAAKDELWESWQRRIDGGLRVHIMEVTADYHYNDGKHAEGAQPGFWVKRYLMPFEKENMREEIQEWKEYMEENVDPTNKTSQRGVIKFTKEKIKCTSVEEFIM